MNTRQTVGASRATGANRSTRSSKALNSSCRSRDIRKSQSARELRPLVRLIDEVTLNQNIVQQRALAVVPQCNALAHAPVQPAEVVFNLAKSASSQRVEDQRHRPAEVKAAIDDRQVGGHFAPRPSPVQPLWAGMARMNSMHCAPPLPSTPDQRGPEVVRPHTTPGMKGLGHSPRGGCSLNPGARACPDASGQLGRPVWSSPADTAPCNLAQ